MAVTPPESGEKELTAATAGLLALEHVRKLTMKTPVGVTMVEPAEDGWVAEVEVVEERRIPSSADMLALYEVEMDLDGNLLAYRRTRRYGRGHTDPGTGGR
ncbi:gas vesicle protein [Amycolatopsis rhizosphaerae]|uniref:Gas vesicle protein n=1 Tax=Amycolatopsis rhizosphaerae TaxID=2053003 RepID=A0A558A9M9_9PSEU|nr:gas vesicle protein GvpO [Amycolatopsis rhizosphaerae]TVT20946.1 gas vesicle protein [Amycolatopsis rhizosphaerae]